MKNTVELVHSSVKLQAFRLATFRNSHPEVFLRKGVSKICSKFTGQHPCRSVVSIKLQSNFIEITLLRGCSAPNWSIFSEYLWGTPLGDCFWTILRLKFLTVTFQGSYLYANVIPILGRFNELSLKQIVFISAWSTKTSLLIQGLLHWYQWTATLKEYITFILCVCAFKAFGAIVQTNVESLNKDFKNIGAVELRVIY